MDSSSNDHQDLEQIEAIDDLLENFWFFDNLLDRKSRILRYCHSDPYPYSSSATYPKPESLKIEDSGSKKLLEATSDKKEDEIEPESSNMSKMRRQFSEKIRVQERKSYLQKKEPLGVKEGSRRNSYVKSAPVGGNLQRTQTLPNYIGRVVEEEEDDSRMGFLICEAIASSSSSSGFTTPTKQITPKVSRHSKPPRNSRTEEEAFKETVIKSQKTPIRKTLSKTLSSLETKKIQNLNTESEKREENEQEQRMVSRAAVKNRFSAVVGQPIPVWAPEDSRKDMKAQIKFWARAVATNVRQEC